LQGRALLPGDQLDLTPQDISGLEKLSLSIPTHLIPVYRKDWAIYALSGPQDDDEFLTSNGREKFYEAKWKVSPSSNRMGIRLSSSVSIDWARKNGGQGGSHPSNILDNGYAFGSVNINGDTPVILTNEGPDMGGYVCVCTIASAER
jgi:urea carboxylase